MSNDIVVAKLENGIVELETKINSLVIKTNDDYVSASENGKLIKGFIKLADEEFDDGIDKANILHKSLVAKKKKYVDPLKILSKKLESILIGWTDLQEKIRQESQRKLDEIARKEREKKEAEARMQREKEEAARREQKRLKRAAEEATNEKERKRLQAEAELKQKEADKAAAKADEKETAAASVVSAVAQPNIAKVSGQSVRDNWKFECTNPVDFVKWASTSGNLHLLTFNQTTCNAHAKSIRKETVVPGGRFYNDQGLTNRNK